MIKESSFSLSDTPMFLGSFIESSEHICSLASLMNILYEDTDK